MIEIFSVKPSIGGPSLVRKKDGTSPTTKAVLEGYAKKHGFEINKATLHWTHAHAVAIVDMPEFDYTNVEVTVERLHFFEEIEL